MKRALLVVGLLAALAGFFSAPEPASAHRGVAGDMDTKCTTDGNVNSLNPDDTHFFPYGFMCGTSADYINNTYISVNVSSGSINGGDTVHVTGSWRDPGFLYDGTSHLPKDNNKNDAHTLTWMTVNAKNATSADVIKAFHITNVSGGGNATLGCPGTGSKNLDGSDGPGVVFGFRDIGNRDYTDSTINNGINASPVAYNSLTDRGIVNCQDHGRMVYWDQAPSTSRHDFSFDIRTDNISTNNVCVRLDISVPFTSDVKVFPDSNDARNPHEQNVNAAHMVKQSQEACFDVHKVPPLNSWDVDMAAVNCNISGHIYKYDGSGRQINVSTGYFLFWWNPSNPDPNPDNRWEVIGGGNTNGGDDSFYVGLSAAKADQIFGNGRDVAFQVRNGGAGWPNGGRLPDSPGGWVMGANQDCHDDPTFVDFTATCHSVTLTSFSDADRLDGLEGAINAYDRGTGSRGWTWIPRGGAPRTIEFNQPPDQSNNGMDIYVGAFAAHPPDGNASTADSNIVQVEHSVGACYAATCELVAYSPGLPPNNVEEGKPFTIRATIHNTGDWDNNPLYSNLSGNDLTITPAWGDMRDNWTVGFSSPRALGKQVNLGEAQYTDFGGYSAPNRLGTFTIKAYADYWGRFAIQQSPVNTSVAPCEATNVKLRQHFHLAPTATLTSDPADGENPTSVTYSTYLTLQNLSNSEPSQAVKAPAVSSFYKLPVGSPRGGAQYVNGAPVNTGGPYNDGRNITINTTTYTVPSGFVAGDKYCSEVTTTQFNDGWIGNGGPDDIIYGTDYNGNSTPQNIAPGPTDTSCVTINNKAFFKVFNNNISAGGDFAEASGGSCSGGGQLGGWFSNTYSNYGFGSSTKLSALALVKIYGVASAQTAYDRSPVDLTFANSVAADQSTGGYSPALGGNYGAGSAAASHCLSAVKPKEGSPNLPSGDVSSLASNSYVAAGNKTLSASGSIGPNQHISVFVNGDVYISSNITYGGGWDKDNIPSFILRASGNIYIAPGVTQLDGLYVATPRVDGAGNTIIPKQGSAIYTCGVAYGPVTGGQTHDICKNQLTVHGAFVADRVNLMRTYGTMRDEAPRYIDLQVGTPEIPAQGQSKGLERYYCGHGGPLGSHFYKISGSGSVPGGCNYEGIIGYVLPDNTTGSNTSAIPMYWVTSLTASEDHFFSTSYDEANAASVDGAPRIAFYLPPAGSPNTTTLYRFYDRNKGYHFYTTNDSEVPSGLITSGQVVLEGGYTIYNRPDQGGIPHQDGVPTVAAHVEAPTYPLDCDNRGITSFTRIRFNGGASTCAAEVFDFSPEMYISDQSLPAPSGGAIQFDAISSLPPVL